MDNNIADHVDALRTLEYWLSIFLFLLVIAAYFLLLNDKERIR
jgi:hypothetical protein